MISQKLAVLMAAFAVVGVTALPGSSVFADSNGHSSDGDNSIETSIERNNSIRQSIDQEQEACTNEADVEIDDDDVVQIGGGNEATVNQANVCKVTQSQSAANIAAIKDNSINVFDVESVIADLF